MDESRISEAARTLLEAARSIGWPIPEGSMEEIEAACMRVVDEIKGAQDRSHARNGIRSAIEAAHAGNAEYVRAGLWEAKKTLSLHGWDDEPVRMEGFRT